MNLNTMTRRRIGGAAAAVLAAILLTQTVCAQAGGTPRRLRPVAVKAGHLVTVDGKVIKDGVLLIAGKTIVAAGADVKIPDGARIVDHSASWVVPGMIDVQSQAGMPRDLREPRDAIDLDNRPAVALVAGHRDFKLLASRGITSVVILPSPDGVVSGVGAVVKTDGAGRAMKANGPVLMSLNASSRKTRRFPTSLMGAFQLLGQTLSKPGNDVLQAVAENKRRSIVRADTEDELRAYLRLAELTGLKSAISTDGSVRRVMGSLPAASMVILPAPTLSTARRDLLVPAELGKRKHAVAFHGSAPGRSATDLRYGAALAVKMGLKSAEGLKSITSHPAAIAGVADRVGSLATGRDADFVVMSGHLLDLGSEIKQTWINGRVVYDKNEVKR